MYEQDLDERTRLHGVEIDEKNVEIDFKNNEIKQLSLKASSSHSAESNRILKRKLTALIRQMSEREIEVKRAIHRNTEHWVNKVKELTALFVELKGFIFRLARQVPREAYMGELFLFKELFKIEELLENNVYSSNHLVIWDLYYKLEVAHSSSLNDISILYTRIDSLNYSLVKKDTTISRLSADIDYYVD